MIDFKSWPKIDLHRHLEGAVRPLTVFELAGAKKQGLPYFVKNAEETMKAMQIGKEEERSLEHFLTKFIWTQNLITDPERLERLCYEAIEDAALDGVVYLELRFNYRNMKAHGLSDQGIMAALEHSAMTAKKKYGIITAFICGIARNLPPDDAFAVVDFAAANMHRGIVGIDLMNDESFGPELFQQVFSRAKEAGLHRTVHAGEAAGPESIIKAISLLDAERIGHGARIFMDRGQAALQALRKGVMIECCPTSNLHTGAIRSIKEHPLPQLFGMGLKACINTDDPSISGITLTNEYELAYSMLHMDIQGLEQMLLNACESVFYAGKREELHKHIGEYFKQNEGRQSNETGVMY